MKNSSKIASVDMLECMQKHSEVSFKYLDDFITDEIKDDLHKFFKENKDEILKSEEKFKALVGDLDDIPDDMKKIKKRYSFVKDKKLGSHLALQAGKGFARRCPKQFAVGAFFEAVNQFLIYYLLKYEKCGFKDASFWFPDSTFNRWDVSSDVIAAGIASCKNYDESKAFILDCVAGGDVTKLSDALNYFIFQEGSWDEVKNKLTQFGVQCLITGTIKLLPKVADKSELDFLTSQFLDFWSKHISGEIDSIIK
jgi:hypothetical protein